jgi:hypothetical protein
MIDGATWHERTLQLAARYGLAELHQDYGALGLSVECGRSTPEVRRLWASSAGAARWFATMSASWRGRSNF